MKKIEGITRITEKNEQILKAYAHSKASHPDALFLFKDGGTYEAYSDDAKIISELVGLVTLRSGQLAEDDGRALYMVGFLARELDHILPKLIRAGHRVAIAEDAPKMKQTFDPQKHLTALAHYIVHDNVMTYPQKLEAVRLFKLELPLPKELADLIEEGIYDWCEENNVDYDSIFTKTDIGDLFKKAV